MYKAAADDSPVIGIVLSVTEDVLHQVDDRTAVELEKGSEIIQDGILVLSGGQKRGKLLIGTNAGPVLYTRFPVQIGNAQIPPLSEELMTNYIACSGGSVLRAKGLNTVDNSPELFSRLLEGFFPEPPETPLVVALTNFVYADKDIGSEFSAYMESMISIALVQSDYFELFTRDKLEQILELQELSISGMFAGDDVRVGELKSIDALLTGRFFDDGDEVLIFLSLLDIESGLLYDTISFPLDKNLVPSSISILPSNTEQAINIIDDLDQVGKSDESNLVISSWPSRGDGGVYYENEELTIKFRATMDCYIKIYHIDVNNKMQLIFPNKYHKDNRLEKDTIYTIPDSSYEFSFVLGKPYGTEFIKVIASTSQFKDIEESFVPLGDGSSGVISRGLTVEQREGKLSEVLFRYTILEKRD